MNKAEIRQKKIQYGLWLGSPEVSREPREAKEFAEVLGVTNVTLSNWKKDSLVKEIWDNATKHFVMGKVREVAERMVENAIKPNAKWQDIRLFLEYTGDLGKKPGAQEPQEVKITIGHAEPKDNAQLPGTGGFSTN